MNHYALIPAKEKSSRCVNKNWRPFNDGKSLVAHLISLVPVNFFDRIILSTDKADVNPMDGVTVHRRDKSLSTVGSPVNDLIAAIIDEYKLPEDGYLWLLNPTSPFRRRADFFGIKEILEAKRPGSVISVSELNPFIWKDSEPLFETGYPRKNTQDVKTKYCVENGQFIVFSVGGFLKTKTWYCEEVLLYKQRGLRSLVDIDFDEDFSDAQRLMEAK